MSLRLYNSLTRTTEPFAPLDPERVRIYVCGLTPSAEAHLGHARSFMFFDVVRRYLVYLGYRVDFVRNVTDVDDRSIAEGHARGIPFGAVVDEFFASFKRSMDRLGVIEPDREPRATKYIPQMLAMIEALVAKGNAYVVGDGVYFSVASFPRYGALSGRNPDELLIGARIAAGEDKRDPLDFALWKFAKPGEPSWPSPWGEGRPGWHIECSAMCHALFGEPFDIHGGGYDLIFPHHENEVAQTESLFAPPMANVWMHGGLLQFDGRKMSKSLGNFEPLSALLERHDPQAIRLLFLQTGYRKPMNFTEESLEGATTGLRRLQAGYDALRTAPPAAHDAAAERAAIEGCRIGNDRPRGPELRDRVSERRRDALAGRHGRAAQGLLTVRARQRKREDGCRERRDRCARRGQGCARFHPRRRAARGARKRGRDGEGRQGRGHVDRRHLGSSRAPKRKEPVDLDDVVYGVHAVEEALVAGESLRRLYVGDERKRDPALRKLLDDARAAGVTIRFESRTFFSQFPYRAHQSVVAFGAPHEYVTLEEALAGRVAGKGLFIVLDHITDPHNAGAIIRSAECAGATAVVLPERRAAGVNATVRKAAAGATAHLPVARVANVAGALRTLKKAGVWAAGAAADPSAIDYTKADLRGDLAIVIGAEGDGISPVVRKECDFLVRIPMFGTLGSLNASVAAGILLFEARRQRDGGG